MWISAPSGALVDTSEACAFDLERNRKGEVLGVFLLWKDGSKTTIYRGDEAASRGQLLRIENLLCGVNHVD